MKVATAGGTTFTVSTDQVTITRHDQPDCVIPLADLEEFVRVYYDADADKDDDDCEDEPE